MNGLLIVFYKLFPSHEGGGLAGLSAALELAERGYKVSIRESESYLGGRAHSAPYEALGKTWQVEHGFHGKYSILNMNLCY